MKPILLAVHDEPGERAAIHRELTSRYAADYEIMCEDSPVSALQRLDALRATPGAAVLVLFAASDMAAMTGVEYLQRAHELYPHARRVLLIPWSNRSASKPILRMISQGRFDRYASVPGRAPSTPPSPLRARHCSTRSDVPPVRSPSSSGTTDRS